MSKPNPTRRQARNYPSTVAEARAMLEQSAIASYRIETIGDWIAPPPAPLGNEFGKRLAATIAENPAAFGRLFLHAIRAARTEGQRHE